MMDNREYYRSGTGWSTAPDTYRQPQKSARPRVRRQDLTSRDDQPARYGAAARRRPALLYLTIALAVVLTFIGVYRFSAIVTNSHEINRLVNELSSLENNTTNLNSRLSAREDLKRISDEAVYNLGMVYPDQSQIYRLTGSAS